MISLARFSKDEMNFLSMHVSPAEASSRCSGDKDIELTSWRYIYTKHDSCGGKVGIMSTSYWKQSITTYGTKLLSITYISEPKIGEIQTRCEGILGSRFLHNDMHNMLSSHVQSISMVCWLEVSQ